MLGSFVFYFGMVVAALGMLGVITPVNVLRMRTRRRGATVALSGFLVAVAGLILPADESHAASRTTSLDMFMPAWQFSEFHKIEVDAPPDSVFNAIKRVRADEISLFRTLTWIRRGGRPLAPGILNPGSLESLIDVALKGGFVRLSETSPRELVIGTVISAPPGSRGPLTPEHFTRQLPPGYTLAAMNFLVKPIGPDRSLVSTETRVFANSASKRRTFAVYWRLIYPGSAIIRVMWLRAIRERGQR